MDPCMKKAKTSLSAVAVAGALVASGVAAVPAADAAAQPHRKQFARTAPAWVHRTHSLGAAPATGRSTFQVYLAPRGGLAALTAAVARVSDPASADYQHFLTAAAYHRRYDATSATVRAVSRWLTGHHLSVTRVGAHHRYLSVTGTNAAVQKAFAVKIDRFKHAGRTVQANTRAVSLPSSIGAYVSTVSGLDTTPNVVKPSISPPPDGFRNARPCSAYYGQKRATTKADGTPLPTFQGKTLPYAVCGYTGKQYRSAYEHNSRLSGRGVTVAIIDAFASPDIAKDANRYARRHGDHGYRRGQLTQHNAATFTHQTDDVCGGENGWWGEETLDVEAVHAMARDAKIRYYGATSCEDGDILLAQARVIDDNKASIVTNSYGEPELVASLDLLAVEQQLFAQAGLQGISLMFSSGDSGDEAARTGTKQADASAVDPFVTAVGGTSDAIGRNGRFKFQTGWGTEKYSLSDDSTSWDPLGFTSGAGGGTSTIFSKPWYQKGVVPARFGEGRSVPDVAMDADPTTGMLVGQTQTFPDGAYYDEYRIGGTSLASPLYAGMTALRVQRTGHRLGFLNPSIYRHAGSASITDIKGEPKDAGNVRADFANSVDDSDGILYSVRAFNRDSSLQVRRGWDDVTGVGSPNYRWLSVRR
jgi:subtilase family serine protease